MSNCYVMLLRQLPLLIMFFIAGCSEVSEKKAAGSSESKPLICHVGGTMRPVITELAGLYEKKTGQKVEINSAGSGELLAYIELQKEGDLYVCHDPFLDIMMKKRLGIDGWVIAELTPVIIVQKGNPKKIKDLQDLTRDDVEVFLTDYRLSSLGRMLPSIFKKAGIDFKELNKKKKIDTNKSGGYVGNMVKMKNADAGIVWNVVAELRRDAVDVIYIDDFLPIPFVDMITSATGKDYKLTPTCVTVATLKCSEQPAAAAEFADFLASDKALDTLKKAGYKLDTSLLGKTYKNGTLYENN